MKKIITLIAILQLATTAYSAGYIVNLGQGVDVLKVHSHRNGGFTVWVNDPKLKNPDSCGDIGKLHIKSTTPSVDQMLTLL
ncbi:MAG: hypothetical protein V2I33_01010 [Kangiellaceae bacterium]|jgi:hypothetical protein|nr:hypothetical protein [Kangiellaceae bacterium]